MSRKQVLFLAALAGAVLAWALPPALTIFLLAIVWAWVMVTR